MKQEKNVFDPNVRHDMVVVIEAIDSNPNGDPDLNNVPRTDPYTDEGLISPMCLKRKIRDRYIGLKQSDENIFVRRGSLLNDSITKAIEKENIKPLPGFEGGEDLPDEGDSKGTNPKSKKKPEDRSLAQRKSDAVAASFWDVRLFGGVLSTGDMGAKSMRGPVQVSWARSLDPVDVIEVGLTRVALTKEKPKPNSNKPADGSETNTVTVTDEEEKNKNDHGEMGKTHIVRYGLYATHVSYNPQQTKDYDNKNRVSSEDLQDFYKALSSMFVNDESAGRNGMAVRGIHVFTHDTYDGSYPAHLLRELVDVRKVDGVEDPRSFRDYNVSVGSVPNSHITYNDMTLYAWE